jgi:DNA-binding CsgD family transcriptional regulator
VSLHGRDVEAATVDGVLRSAHAGASAQLVIVGEAGIGKTALITAAAERAADDGMHVLHGRAAVHERSVPFGPVIDALDEQASRMNPARLAAAEPELAGVLPSAADRGGIAGGEPGPGERFRYHRALRAFVEILARERPLALLLDDVQWADEASLEWILHLARRPPDAPCALIVAARQSEAASRVLGALRGAGEHIALAPLDRGAALATLRDVHGLAGDELQARIVDDAGGNPLFLLELARAARRSEDGLPATIAAAVAREVTELPPERRRMLQAAAVVGDPFDAALASAAAGLTPETGLELLDDLAEADLIRPHGGATFAFRHPLLRRGVYDGAPPGWRQRAHERAAHLLAERGASASRRAYHVECFAQMGDEEAVAVLEAAAAEDVGCSPASAARWYEAALRLLTDTARDRCSELLLPFGDALAAAGRLPEALDVFDRALAAGPPEGRAAVVLRAAGVERLLSRNEAARRRLLDAVESETGSVRADLELELGAAAFALGDVEATVRHIRASAEHSPTDDLAAIALADALDAFAGLWSRQPDRSLMERAEQRALALSDDVRFEPLMWIGLLSWSWERFGPAALILQRAVDGARRARRELGLPQLRSALALALVFDLHPEAALDSAQASEDGARLQNTPAQVGFAASTRAMALDLLGRPGEAVAAATESQEVLARSERTVYNSIATVVNLAILHEHDPERLLAKALPVLGEDRLRGRPTSLLRPLVEAALATGRRAEAVDWTERVASDVERMGSLPAACVRVACSRAELALDAAPWRAVELARQAVTLGAAATVRTDTTRARITLGRALASAGERDAAIAELERAILEASAGGAQRLVAEATRELRRLGARPSAAVRRSTGIGDGLSERERSIAELVAEGRSNKEVAAALFVSLKTVENNLSRIYVKLGIRSRTELARVLLR